MSGTAIPVPAYQVKELAYIVRSATDAGVVYTVTLDRLGYHCTCKARAFPKTRGRCWHVKAVLAGMYLGKPHAKVQLAPAPAPAPAANPSGWLWSEEA